MDRNFGGFIWTNHALDRLRQRDIKQGDAWATLIHPDNSRYAITKQAYIYYRNIRNQHIEVVAKQNEKKEWLVLSVWSKPEVSIHKNNFSLWKSLIRLFKNFNLRKQ